MIIHNNEPLSTYEAFWHLYLATIESPTDILPLLSETQVNAQSLATKVFRSLEKKGEYPLHPYSDDYCLSMPEDRDEFELKKQDLADQLTFKLWRSHPEGDCEQLLETLFSVAEALASTDVEYEPPIKAFLLSAFGIRAITQGYGFKVVNASQLVQDLKVGGYVVDETKISRDSLAEALVVAIRDNYWGDPLIQVHFTA